MKITIGGMPGSGKSIVGQSVAQALGYKFYSIGGIRRELAKKRGLTIGQYNALDEDTDTQVDDFQRELGKKGDDFIIEGRLSFHFVPDSLKVYFDCDLMTAAERIFKTSRTTEDKGKTVKEAYDNLKARIDSDRERYRRYYDLDAYDRSKFDFVIDTTRLSLDDVRKKVLDFVKKRT